MTVVFAILICLFAGISSGLLGIGGGIIMVPLFHYLLKMDFDVAIGTSLALIVPTALAGIWPHAAAHNIDWKIVLFAALFAILGGVIGASLSVKIDVTILRKIFAVFLILVAVKLLWQP